MISVGHKRPHSLPVFVECQEKYECLSNEEAVTVAKRILATPDKQLGEEEYSLLFSVPGPKELYDELIYFLPHAFRFMYSHSSYDIDFIYNIISFISRQREKLQYDGLDTHVLSAVVSCINKWTKYFRVIHVEGSILESSGSSLRYGDYVVNSDKVFFILEALIREGEWSSLAEYIVVGWSSRHGTRHASGWYLETCRQIYWEIFLWATDAINKVVTQRESREYHLRRFGRIYVDNDLVPATYWQDLQALPYGGLKDHRSEMPSRNWWEL